MPADIDDAGLRDAWELRTRAGWIPIENPLERAARDAERVRHWLSDDDRDFLVKAYAAVVIRPGASLERTATCAVLTADQVPDYIASLPAQRTLTASRLDGVLDRFVRPSTAPDAWRAMTTHQEDW